MSLQERITDLADAVGADIKTLTDTKADLTDVPNIVISATEPATPVEGMIWIQLIA